MSALEETPETRTSDEESTTVSTDETFNDLSPEAVTARKVQIANNLMESISNMSDDETPIESFAIEFREQEDATDHFDSVSNSSTFNFLSGTENQNDGVVLHRAKGKATSTNDGAYDSLFNTVPFTFDIGFIYSDQKTNYDGEVTQFLDDNQITFGELNMDEVLSNQDYTRIDRSIVIKIAKLLKDNYADSEKLYKHIVIRQDDVFNAKNTVMASDAYWNLLVNREEFVYLCQDVVDKRTDRIWYHAYRLSESSYFLCRHDAASLYVMLRVLFYTVGVLRPNKGESLNLDTSCKAHIHLIYSMISETIALSEEARVNRYDTYVNNAIKIYPINDEPVSEFDINKLDEIVSGNVIKKIMGSLGLNDTGPGGFEPTLEMFEGNKRKLRPLRDAICVSPVSFGTYIDHKEEVYEYVIARIKAVKSIVAYDISIDARRNKLAIMLKEMSTGGINDLYDDLRKTLKTFCVERVSCDLTIDSYRSSAFNIIYNLKEHVIENESREVQLNNINGIINDVMASEVKINLTALSKYIRVFDGCVKVQNCIVDIFLHENKHVVINYRGKEVNMWDTVKDIATACKKEYSDLLDDQYIKLKAEHEMLMKLANVKLPKTREGDQTYEEIVRERSGIKLSKIKTDFDQELRDKIQAEKNATIERKRKAREAQHNATPSSKSNKSSGRRASQLRRRTGFTQQPSANYRRPTSSRGVTTAKPKVKVDLVTMFNNYSRSMGLEAQTKREVFGSAKEFIDQYGLRDATKTKLVETMNKCIKDYSAACKLTMGREEVAGLLGNNMSKPEVEIVEPVDNTTRANVTLHPNKSATSGNVNTIPAASNSIVGAPKSSAYVKQLSNPSIRTFRPSPSFTTNSNVSNNGNVQGPNNDIRVNRDVALALSVMLITGLVCFFFFRFFA